MAPSTFPVSWELREPVSMRGRLENSAWLVF